MDETDFEDFGPDEETAAILADPETMEALAEWLEDLAAERVKFLREQS